MTVNMKHAIGSMFSDNADRADVRAYLCHVTDKMNAWQTLLGKGMFTAAESATMHPALLRDLQPYSGVQMAQSLIGTLEVYMNACGPIRRIFRRRRINKLGLGMVTTAAELSLLTRIRDRQDSFENRKQLRHRLGVLLKQAHFAISGTAAIGDLQANYLIDFFYLPENIDRTLDDMFENRFRKISTYQLDFFRRSFDRFYEWLMQITIPVAPAIATGATKISGEERKQ